MGESKRFLGECDHIAASCALFATRRLGRTLSRLFDEELAQRDLKGTQYNLLVAIARGAGRNLSELGALLGMDRTTVTHALRPLVRARLVEMIKTSDRRARGAQLTALGRARVRQAMPLWRRAQKRVERAAGADSWTILNRQLRQLNRKLQQRSASA
jgi:DNA-binding MarR family transcriptional regulator